MTGCPISTTVVPDNTPLECEEFILDKCIVHNDSIAFLSLPAGATQEQVNNALVLALMNAFTRISELENQLDAIQNP